jgi:uncharacterized membrane protein
MFYTLKSQNDIHISKTITYRILATITTVLMAFYCGTTIQVASILGMTEIVIKPIIYFIHEKIWHQFLGIREEKFKPRKIQ